MTSIIQNTNKMLDVNKIARQVNKIESKIIWSETKMKIGLVMRQRRKKKLQGVYIKRIMLALWHLQLLLFSLS